MERIEVTARWEVDGGVIPLDFRYQGSYYAVESVGRSWRDEAGLHVLVMEAGGRAFELIFQMDELTWYLGYHGNRPSVV